jgi:hypothetical protein
MRCIVGLTLFLVLYFGSCRILYEGVTAMTFRSGHGYSQREAQRAGAEAVRKYHALVAVGAGAASLLACSVPTLLTKMSQRDVHWQ